jgi:putative CRISPR-associated protein (TIGR02619 family)
MLTNYIYKIYNIEPKKIYTYSNADTSEIDNEFLEKIDAAIEKLKEEILTLDNNSLKRLSAELNALITFYGGNFNNKDFHLVLHTDTYLGEKIAEILEFFLTSKGVACNKFRAKDLKTSSVEEFEWALGGVVKDLSEIIDDYKISGYEIIFNLTGGFKGVNSFLQTMASLWADKSIYIFESSSKLLEIPRMPITIDYKLFENNLEEFLKLERGERVNLENIPKSIVLKLGDEYVLSPWGEIVWQKFKSEYLKENLINPYKERITFSNEFKKDFQKLNPHEKSQLNKKLIELSKMIKTNKEYNPSSLRYHSLSGEIASKYKYEFYPFDGNDSRRVFCNETNGKIVIEKIDSHLK